MSNLNANSSNPETLRLQKLYNEKVIPAMMAKFKYENINQVPKINKIVLNMGVGEAAQDKKIVQLASGNLEAISGQKPKITMTRKSIAGFKIRDGWPIGCMVTLRRARMYEFLDRLISLALPRTRDFRGVSPRGFDSRGNYNMGIKEQTIFPEVDYDKVDAIRGLNITITTTAKTDEEGYELLKLFSFPFRENPTQNQGK